MRKYTYFNKYKIKTAIKAILLSLSIISCFSMVSFAGEFGWKRGISKVDSWWYVKDDGVYLSDGAYWIDDNGDGTAKRYYFDKDGWLITDRYLSSLEDKYKNIDSCPDFHYYYKKLESSWIDDPLRTIDSEIPEGYLNDKGELEYGGYPSKAIYSSEKNAYYKVPSIDTWDLSDFNDAAYINKNVDVIKGGKAQYSHYRGTLPFSDYFEDDDFEKKRGWYKNKYGLWMYYSNDINDGGLGKSYIRDKWQWIDADLDGKAECYYFNGDGIMLSDTDVSGYHLNADGKWCKDSLVYIAYWDENKGKYIYDNKEIDSCYGKKKIEKKAIEKTDNRSYRKGSKVGGRKGNYNKKTYNGYYNNSYNSNYKYDIYDDLEYGDYDNADDYAMDNLDFDDYETLYDDFEEYMDR